MRRQDLAVGKDYAWERYRSRNPLPTLPWRVRVLSLTEALPTPFSRSVPKKNGIKIKLLANNGGEPDTPRDLVVPDGRGFAMPWDEYVAAARARDERARERERFAEDERLRVEGLRKRYGALAKGRGLSVMGAYASRRREGWRFELDPETFERLLDIVEASK